MIREGLLVFLEIQSHVLLPSYLNFANTVPIAGQLVNDLRNIVFNDNAAIGTLWKRKEFINDKIRKAFKLPFQSSIPMKIKIQVAEQLRGVKEATDPRAREVANEIKKKFLIDFM